LFAGQPPSDEKKENVSLPEMTIAEHVVQDYAATALSLKAHPVSFVREKLQQLHILSASQLATAKNGQPVKVAGLVLVRQRPGTAGSICFMTIEDETGFANIVIFHTLFDTYRKEILQARFLMTEGHLQIQGEVIHVIVNHCYDFPELLRKPSSSNNETPALPDEKTIPIGQNKRSQVRENTQKKIFPEARNFR